MNKNTFMVLLDRTKFCCHAVRRSVCQLSKLQMHQLWYADSYCQVLLYLYGVIIHSAVVSDEVAGLLN